MECSVSNQIHSLGSEQKKQFVDLLIRLCLNAAPKALLFQFINTSD